MVAHKVAFRVVASDCMPTTAGTLGVPAVFFSGVGHEAKYVATSTPDGNRPARHSVADFSHAQFAER